MKKSRKYLILAMFAFLFVLEIMEGAAEAADEAQSVNINKYNVVFVIDESGSMLKTDSGQLRYNAANLFLGLMTQEGNYAGTVSFDDGIIYSQDLMPISGTDDKQTVFHAIKDNSTTGGDTDIGGALNQAVVMLDAGVNPDCPSVIILLTDGNTDLDNKPDILSEKEQESLQKKAEAIENARQKGYKVYSICLNENGAADISETKQISDATGGYFSEVTKADDLREVFEMFYQMIYGTPNDLIYEGKAPVDAPFLVPEAGVEEANIMIQGKVTSVRFTNPAGKNYTNVETTDCGNVLLEKIVDPQSGKWIVSVDGDPGATIQIRLLYNYDFRIRDTSVFEDSYNAGDVVSITANMTNKDGDDIRLTKADEYTAEVRFLDANNKETETLSMKLQDGRFAADYEVPEQDRAYRYYIAVVLNKKTENGTIFKKSEIRQFVSGNNTAPVSKGDITETIKMWPFRDNTYTLDMTTLASDAEDKTLECSVISSSFIDKATDPKGDYSVSGNILTQDRYSLGKGSYTIRCTDSGGMYCDVNVTITTIPIGLLTILGIVIIAIIVAAVILFGVYTALKTPFYGDIYVKQTYDGEEIKRMKARGRIPLNAFNIPIDGVNGKKSYLQAMRGEGVTLVTNKEVTVNGRKAKEHVIPAGGTGTPVQLGDNENNVIYIRFASRISGGRRRSGGRKNTRRTVSRQTGSARVTRGTRGTGR